MREAALLLRRQTHTWCPWELVQVALGPLRPPWMVRVPGVVLYPAGFLCPDPAALALGATRTLLVLSCCAKCFCGDLTVWIQETSRHWRPPPPPPLLLGPHRP